MNKQNVMDFYCAWFCPFAQRVWISLLENDISFNYIEIDPYDKNDEWMEISKGAGTVPVLVGNGATQIDSWKILEFLDKKKNLQEIKDLNHWQNHINKKIIPYFYRFLKSRKGELQDESKEKLIEGIYIFAKSLNETEGPFFCGNNISIVDISFIPFAYRINLLLKEYRNFRLPRKGEEWSSYDKWHEIMINRKSFVESLKGVKNYEKSLIDLYEIYSKGGGQNNVTEID